MPTSDFSYKRIKRPGLLRRAVGRLPLALLRHVFFLRECGRWGNFRSPRSFGEKMQWRIINDRRSILRNAADRLQNRELIRTLAPPADLSIALPELLAAADNPDQLVARLKERARNGSLPPRWLIKPNNSSGEVLVVDGPPDWQEIRAMLEQWTGPGVLETVHWLWANAMAEKGFVAETWIGDPKSAPEEWKIFVVGGQPRFYVINRRDNAGNTRIHLDEDWNEMPTWHHNAGGSLGRDQILGDRSQMDHAASFIGREWDLLRVDLFWSDGKIWFGELTPYPSEGLVHRAEGGPEFDRRLGDLWKLPALDEVQ
jgi:hypothetical protein